MLLSQSSFDDRPYKITKLLIGSFIGAFIFVMVFNQNLFKDIASLWGAWIGAAIGYFFGSRPVDKLIEKIEDITKLAEQYLRDLDITRNSLLFQQQQYTQAQNIINQAYIIYQNQLRAAERIGIAYRDALGDLSSMLEEFGSQLPQEVRDRLNSYVNNNNM